MANPAATLAKWKANSGRAVEDYKNGVKAVSVSPTQKAAQAQDKWLSGIMDAHSSGRFAAALNAISTQEWIQQTVDKGSKNYQTGISNLSPRAAKAMADQQQYAETVKQAIANMPNNSEADADARMLEAVKLMRQYKKQR